jgi:Rod binding domain-containing protein
MDTAQLNLTQPVLPPVPLERSSVPQQMSEERKEQVAKGFESILINKILDEMKNATGQWGFEKDEASRQVDGLYTLYLSDFVAKNGGLGLWKEIYESLFPSAR